MAISCLPKNFIFDNSNFTRAHIAQLVEHFYGKEEVACSIHAVGTNIYSFFESFSLLITLAECSSLIKISHKDIPVISPPTIIQSKVLINEKIYLSVFALRNL